MGRKIPGRKHHGVKDPEKQRQERLKSLKFKINAPPSNPDDQQVPKSLVRFMELKSKAKTTKTKPKKTKRPKKFDQQTNETDRDFLNRVNRHCAMVKHEAAFASKFGVEIKRNEDGEVEEVTKRPKDPIQLMLKEVRQQKKKKKKKKGQSEDVPKLSKSEKRKLKLTERREKKEYRNIDEFKDLKDDVKFGEQVHAPPTLSVPKKIAALKRDSSRPGKKDLLLKAMLNRTSNNVIDKKSKRKALPHAMRRQLDKQQQEVIDAYRLLKSSKNREAL